VRRRHIGYALIAQRTVSEIKALATSTDLSICEIRKQAVVGEIANACELPWEQSSARILQLRLTNRLSAVVCHASLRPS
jgi:hypothetical protein